MAKRKSLKGKKLSTLLAIAMRDLLAVEKMKDRFKVDMNTWHEMNDIYDDAQTTRKCCVCMAGAVLSCTLKIEDAVEVDPNVESRVIDSATQQSLFAINSLREGRLYSACDALGKELPFGLASRVSVTPYEMDRAQFFRDMKKLHGLLLKHGL